MDIVINPTFKDIFPDEDEDLDKILSNIPSFMVVSILSAVNSELYLSKGKTTQVKILEFFLFRQSPHQRKIIFKNINDLFDENRNRDLQLFTYKSSLEFIHYTLLNFNYIDFKDSTPEQELKIFKAYLIFSTRVHKNYRSLLPQESDNDEDFFRKQFWPIMVNQIDVNHLINPFVNLIKGLNFLNFFQLNQPEYLENFLQSKERNNIWDFITDFMTLLQSGTKKNR